MCVFFIFYSFYVSVQIAVCLSFYASLILIWVNIFNKQFFEDVSWVLFKMLTVNFISTEHHIIVSLQISLAITNSFSYSK